MGSVIKRVRKQFAIFKGNKNIFQSPSFDECVEKLGKTPKSERSFSSYNPKNDVKIHLTSNELAGIFEQTGGTHD